MRRTRRRRPKRSLFHECSTFSGLVLDEITRHSNPTRTAAAAAETAAAAAVAAPAPPQRTHADNIKEALCYAGLDVIHNSKRW